MSKYEPETVAVATVRGVPNVRVLRGHREGYWSHANDVDDRRLRGAALTSDDCVTDIRPLVVLDLAAANTYITEAEVAAAAIETLRGSDRISDSGLAAQIEAQTRPPKPTEPTGLGAVVEDTESLLWVRVDGDDYPWFAPESRDFSAYKAINVVRILSEGVTA